MAGRPVSEEKLAKLYVLVPHIRATKFIPYTAPRGEYVVLGIFDTANNAHIFLRKIAADGSYQLVPRYRHTTQDYQTGSPVYEKNKTIITVERRNEHKFEVVKRELVEEKATS